MVHFKDQLWIVRLLIDLDLKYGRNDAFWTRRPLSMRLCRLETPKMVGIPDAKTGNLRLE